MWLYDPVQRHFVVQKLVTCKGQEGRERKLILYLHVVGRYKRMGRNITLSTLQIRYHRNKSRLF